MPEPPEPPEPLSILQGGLPEIDLRALAKKSPAERKEIEAKLLRYKKALEENPLWKYRPHDQQRKFHEAAGVKIRALMGGNRSGKSHAGVMDDAIQCVDRDVVPPWLQPYKLYEPPCYVRIVTPDLTTTGEGVVVDKMRHLIPATQLKGGKFDKAFDQRRMRLDFANGSTIEFLSTEQELNKHGGSGRHRVHFDEEPHGNKGQRIFTEALYRVTDFGGDITFTMTPLVGLTWSYDLLTVQGVPRFDEEVQVITASTYDNPHIDQETVKWAEMLTDPEERQARIEGNFVALQGLIYPEFKPEIHVIPDEAPPKGARIYVGIDPGYRYMAAVVYAYLDHEDNLVIFDEIALQKATARDVCEAIHATNALYEVDPTLYVIDPAARNKVHQTGRDDQAEYLKYGIPVIPGNNSRRLGFGQIKNRLNDETLLVCGRCEVLIDQFRKYRWRKPPHGESDGKEEPVKKDDHALDALRYLVMSDPVSPNLPKKEEPKDQRTRLFREHLKRVSKRDRKVGHHVGGIYY
jgi:hypothetical protein